MHPIDPVAGSLLQVLCIYETVQAASVLCDIVHAFGTIACHPDRPFARQRGPRSLHCSFTPLCLAACSAQARGLVGHADICPSAGSCRFWLHWLILLLTNTSSCALFRGCAALGRDPIIASTVGVLAIFAVVFSGGIMIARWVDPTVRLYQRRFRRLCTSHCHATAEARHAFLSLPATRSSRGLRGKSPPAVAQGTEHHLVLVQADYSVVVAVALLHFSSRFLRAQPGRERVQLATMAETLSGGKYTLVEE